MHLTSMKTEKTILAQCKPIFLRDFGEGMVANRFNITMVQHVRTTFLVKQNLNPRLSLPQNV